MAVSKDPLKVPVLVDCWVERLGITVVCTKVDSMDNREVAMLAVAWEFLKAARTVD